MTPSTPQRANRSAHSHSHSLSYSHLRSPSSPATPYTPLSLRSFASSNPSPALTTPASVRNFPAGLKHSHFASPQVAKSYTSSPNVSRDQSLADLARNWRSCASKNGIKVATCDAPQFDDDDAIDMSFYDANDSGFITAEEGASSILCFSVITDVFFSSPTPTFYVQSAAPCPVDFSSARISCDEPKPANDSNLSP
ncbi:uncharacterized protein ARMOST_16269 [Armillaria ostoyae]|uniref:Uncharacterized protein n=1 Tax=Armillaria ostoyae TaxID=47428 RepID=A0A284RVR7_ARMOS|nr:uncharacterized protein ARMOST_16269 [Armillaria ostoyae]